MNTAILYDPSRRAWLHFSQPRQVIQAMTLADVLPALARVEDQVNQGLYAAGFVSYEAAPALAPFLQTHPPAGFPLLWFGLYDRPQESVALPAPLEVTPTGQAPPLDWQPLTSRATYTRAIEAIKDHIARGDTYQVNYTIRLRAAIHGAAWESAPWELFVRLANAQGAAAGAAYAAYIDTGDFAICSASPELFFRLEGDTLTSKPMKGTTRRGLTLSEDREQAAWLHHSEKNRAENLMIVDMMRNDLGRVAQTGSVHVPELFTTERYPTVWQMTSTVRCTTSANLMDILLALFPCASITGAPKASTMRIIRALEDTPRRIYTGCIGWITPGRRAQFNVAIRTALVDRRTGQVEYGVGGGIIWDSTAEDEYNECLLKARLLQTDHPSFDLLESLAWLPAKDGYLLLERHLRRLADSAEYFGYPLDPVRVRQALLDKAQDLPAMPHKVRLLVGPRGEVTVEAAPIRTSTEPVKLGFAPEPVDPADPFLYHKTTRREVYDRALAACPGCDDAILWDPAGEVTETCTANLLIRLGEAWYTPPVSASLLAGTLRAELLENGETSERPITLAELRAAPEIHVINSVRGRRPARLV